MSKINRVKSITSKHDGMPTSDEIETLVLQFTGVGYTLQSHCIFYHPELNVWLVNYIFQS